MKHANIMERIYCPGCWLAVGRDRIEDGLFFARRGKAKPQLFLYDVTGSYLEGDQNFFDEYGYDVDKKRGKKQIVVGLLCDEYGEPVSTEVFAGTEQDPQTFCSQVQKVVTRFDCNKVTFVGNRGMIKSTQIANLPEDFHYIRAITRPQINTLLKRGLIQIELFDENISEIEDDGIRYILHHNPRRAAEVADNRLSQRRNIEEFVEKNNLYLREHQRAKVSTAIRDVQGKIDKLKIDKWFFVQSQDRMLSLSQNNSALEEESRLDGCYVIKTDLPQEEADRQIIHGRNKDLAEVEWVFRTCKTGHLEVRPVFVRTEESTRGHVLVVMLAYMIVRRLRQAWTDFDCTVEEGIKQLSTLYSMEVKVKGEGSCLQIPRPRKKSRDLLKALDVWMPTVLPHREVNVDTRKN